MKTESQNNISQGMNSDINEKQIEKNETNDKTLLTA